MSGCRYFLKRFFVPDHSLIRKRSRKGQRLYAPLASRFFVSFLGGKYFAAGIWAAKFFCGLSPNLGKGCFPSPWGEPSNDLTSLQDVVQNRRSVDAWGQRSVRLTVIAGEARSQEGLGHRRGRMADH
jgi:hypothetical protein